MVEGLIQAGADVNAQNKDNSTPLHLASAGGHDVVVTHLLLHRVAVDVTKKRNQTPLHLGMWSMSSLHEWMPLSDV